MCTVLLPPGDNPIAVNRYTYQKATTQTTCVLPTPTAEEDTTLRLGVLNFAQEINPKLLTTDKRKS